MGGAHDAWGDDHEPEYDEDTGSWEVPDKTRTPGYRGVHRRPPGKVRAIVNEVIWRLAQ